MKTKIELMAMTIAELRKEASNQKVKNYGKLSKTELVEAVSASYEEKSQDESFTDSKGEVIQKGDKVSVRIGNKLFPGTISGMKKIENDQYVHVMLDGNDKTKMFHTGDVTKSKEDMLVKKPNGGVMYIAPEVSGELESNNKSLKSTPDETKSVTPKEKTVSKSVIKRKEVPEFTQGQRDFVDSQLSDYQSGKISKKETVINLMEFGIMKQQIDRFVDSKILHWSYVYDIYRVHGK